ncbi:MAG: ComEC/Rec2 family competence protein [Pseudomonadota bacterium]
MFSIKARHIKHEPGDAEAQGEGLSTRGARTRFSSSGLITFFKLVVEREARREIDHAEPLVWFVVLFISGIAAYFAVPQEPNVTTMVVTVCVLAITCYGVRTRGTAFAIVSALLALQLGFTVATGHTFIIGHTMLQKPVTVMIEGTVSTVEVRENGAKRIILSDVTSVGRDRGVVPDKVRLLLPSKRLVISPGERVRLRASLKPPPGPVLPGGYDFGRDLYFKGIGATGFSLGEPEKLADFATHSSKIPLIVSRWRADIAARVRTAFLARDDPRGAGIATALLVGERGGIGPETRQSLARSGLAHILAISGLHMALVVTCVIIAARALLAVFASIAVQLPTRSLAIAVGLFSGFVYFLLSGGSVSATRAFVMVTIVALAMLLGRRAFSVRNVALAAMGLLVIKPNWITGPGFQMSFAATLMLVVFASYLLNRPPSPLQQRPAYGAFLHGLGKYIAALAVTSVLAGLATGLFAAFHFYRIAPLGLFANLGGIPIFSAVVMPFGFLSMLAMPFGLEAIPLRAMAFGIDAIMWISDDLARRTLAVGNTGRLAFTPFLLVATAAVLFCILKSRLRFAVLLAFLLGLIFLGDRTDPSVMISEDGKTVAVRHENGLVVSGIRSGKFEVANWRSALGFPPEDGDNKDGIVRKPSCDSWGCAFSSQNLVIAHVKHPAAFRDDCNRADVVVSRLSAPGYCHDQALVIDRKSLASGGSHALYIRETWNGDQSSLKVERAIPAIKRPWHHHYLNDEINTGG